MVIAESPQVNSLEKKPFLLPGHPSYNSPVISKRVINMAKLEARTAKLTGFTLATAFTTNMHCGKNA